MCEHDTCNVDIEDVDANGLSGKFKISIPSPLVLLTLTSSMYNFRM